MTTPQSPGQWPDPTYQAPVPPSWPPPAPVPPPSAPPVYPAYQTPASYGSVPGYAPPPPYAVQQSTNGLAIASMVVALVGICGFLLLPIAILFVVGAILGHVALTQVRQTGQQGAGFAKAGIIIGWIGTGLALIDFIVSLAFIYHR
jgi:Domain of unknown function (DUF4190)